MTQQAIHWAKLAAKTDPNTVTLIVTPDVNWYQNYSPYTGPFPDTHVLAHFAADTITYNVPTQPQNHNKPHIEPLAIHILCIHHQNNNFGTPNQIDTLKTAIDNLQITQYHIQNIPPTPNNTHVNKNTKWSKLLYPPHTNSTLTPIPPIPSYETLHTLKCPSQYSYYTDGSFIPPMQANDGHWKKEKAGYEIYNPTKTDIRISKRLSGLQTIFRAELMAIHKTLKIITTKYPNEPTHIFTDCLNCLYVINTQIKHPTHHTNHVDKTILTSMVEMLKNRTQPTTIYKVKAHINIDGNEQADQLAKLGTKKRYSFATKAYEFAHTTPYYFQKDTWPGPNKRPDKGPIRCLQTYLTKHDRDNNLKKLAINSPTLTNGQQTQTYTTNYLITSGLIL